MPVRIPDTCTCMNCAHLNDHYWMSATMDIIKCWNISGQIEARTFHALDKHWCPRWKLKACRGGCWSEGRNYIPGMRIATEHKEWKEG